MGPQTSAILLAAQDAATDRLLSRLIGANLGGVIVLLAFLRRLRAARRGRKLELHFLYRSAPWPYAGGWVLAIGFAVALIRRDVTAIGPLALFGSFVVLWIVIGLVLRRDRKLELGMTR
jgi:hypothetical protein